MEYKKLFLICHELLMFPRKKFEAAKGFEAMTLGTQAEYSFNTQNMLIISKIIWTDMNV